MSRHSNSDYKVYVGDLGSSASKQELEDAFGYYGPLRNVWVARNPPGFAFIEFEDARDAEDAVRGLDGRTVCGRRVRVEHSSSALGRRRGGPPTRRRAFNPDDRCYECGERGHYARDCKRYRPHRSSRRSRSYSKSRSRSRGRGSRSRSRSRGRKSSRSVSKDRSRSKDKDRSMSPLRDKSLSRSSRSRSRDSERRNGIDD